MSLVRYECEYCHKILNNNPSEKARHFKTLEHQRNVRSWYESVEIAQNRNNPLPPICILFQNGNCPNGDACPFRHIRETVVDEDLVTIIPRGVIHSDVEGVDNPWIVIDKQDELEEKKKEEEHINEYKEILLSIADDLPPSLIPPTKSNIQACARVDWG